jgi:tetratricopeptide (TPR) repeat protein
MRNTEMDLNLSFGHHSPIEELVSETFDTVDAVENAGVYQSNGRLNAPLLFKNAKILLQSGDIALAKNIFRALIERGEMLGQSYAGLAAIFELEDKTELAIKSYREAIIYEPTYSSLLALGELFVHKQDYQNAIGTLLRANNLPKITAAQQFLIHKNLGNCYMHLSQLNNAEAHYRKAYELDAQSDALHVNIGSLALKKNDTATALLHYREAVRINPKNAGAHTGIGLSLMAQGSKQAAHDAFVSALQIDIHEISALFNLVRCAYELRSFEQVSLILQEYIKNNTVNSNILYSYAGILYHRCMYKEALEECDKLLAFNEHHEGAKKIKELIHKAKM